MRNEITYYAIREINSGYYLPALPKGLGAGYSHMKPISMHSDLMRLFKTEIQAKRALDSWCRGMVWKRTKQIIYPLLTNNINISTAVTTVSSNAVILQNCGSGTELVIEKVPSRIKSNFEIIPIVLIPTR